MLFLIWTDLKIEVETSDPFKRYIQKTCIARTQAKRYDARKLYYIFWYEPEFYMALYIFIVFSVPLLGTLIWYAITIAEFKTISSHPEKPIQEQNGYSEM